MENSPPIDDLWFMTWTVLKHGDVPQLAWNYHRIYIVSQCIKKHIKLQQNSTERTASQPLTDLNQLGYYGIPKKGL